MKVENITRICFTTGWATKNERNLTIGNSLLGEVIKDDKHVLALVHEILGKSTSGVRGEELVGRRVGSGGGNDNGVIESAGFFENGNGPCNVRLLLANTNVDTVNGLVILQTTFGGCLVLVRLRNNGIDRDSGLTGGTVTNDKFTLTTADWNHGIDCGNSGLKRHGNRLSLNNSGSNLLNRILVRCRDLTLAVDRLSESIDNPTEEIFTNGNRKKLSGRLALHPFGDVLSVTEEHDTNFAFLKVQCETGEPAGELDHLVQLCVTKTFNFRDTVTGFTDDTNVGLLNRSVDVVNLGFQFLENAAHDNNREKLGRLKSVGETVEASLNRAIKDVVSDADAETAEKIGLGLKFKGKILAVLRAQGRSEGLSRFGIE